MYQVLLALWLFVLPGLFAPWHDYPAPVDAYINDFAGVLSDAEADQIADRLDRLYRETGVEAVVVTVPSFSSFGTGDRTLEIFATNLFNTWAITQFFAEHTEQILYFTEQPELDAAARE